MRKFICLVFGVWFFSAIAQAEQPVAYGPTTSNDQLWQIAMSLRPNTAITVEQTMLAILKANPEAFTDNNAYRLKSGYVLVIPEIDLIKQVSIESAAKQIEEQHDVFLGIKKKINVEQQEIKLKNEPKKEDNSEANKLIVEELRQKIATTSQEYQERLKVVEQHHQVLQAKIEELTSGLDSLKQEIKSAHISLYSYAQWMHNFFGATGLKLLAGLALLLIIWWSLLHYKQSKVENAKFKSSCDFMSGEEGMNAKLDLARAYIDMSDKESARKVLAEVREFGNSKQKVEAQELMNKCV
jgi:FimV-like protein